MTAKGVRRGEVAKNAIATTQPGTTKKKAMRAAATAAARTLLSRRSTCATGLGYLFVPARWVPTNV
jgi:hypothetical protein